MITTTLKDLAGIIVCLFVFALVWFVLCMVFIFVPEHNRKENVNLCAPNEVLGDGKDYVICDSPTGPVIKERVMKLK